MTNKDEIKCSLDVLLYSEGKNRLLYRPGAYHSQHLQNMEREREGGREGGRVRAEAESEGEKEGEREGGKERAEAESEEGSEGDNRGGIEGK